MHMGNSKIKSAELSLFADYFQFYIQDEAVVGDLSQSWGEEATSRLLAIAPGTIGIGTVRNMDVPVVIEIHDQARAKKQKNPPRFRGGFFVSVIVSRSFPFLADLAATYSSKP